MGLKAAIYHFTDKSEIRPSVCEKQIQKLKDFTLSKGFEVSEIFVDKSLIRGNHTEFDRFWKNRDKFDVLITKDFYHISKNTGMCMRIMQELRDVGIEVYSIENGSFSWLEAPFSESRRVATYTSRYCTDDTFKKIITVHNDVMKLFVERKTNWILINQYSDKTEHQNDAEQIQLMKLIQNKNKYDLLLVHNLNDIHWRTANLCRIRNQLQLDIYSLQEGFLAYGKETTL